MTFVNLNIISQFLLYLNLQKSSKVRMAIIMTDEEEPFNIIITGPNPYSRTYSTYTIYKDTNRNFSIENCWSVTFVHSSFSHCPVDSLIYQCNL